jgi:hypothetical protein
MTYSKSFPKTIEGRNFPTWEEVYLTEEEEASVEEQARQEHKKVMKECIEEAKTIFQEMGLKDYQSDLINMAIALFRKRAAYSIHHKEQKAKEKFDRQFK